MRRPVMPSFHAAWSFGGLAGAAIGGLAAPHLSPLTHFALVGLLGLVVTATCGRIILRSDLPAELAQRAVAEASGIEAAGGADRVRSPAVAVAPSPRLAQPVTARRRLAGRQPTIAAER